MLLNAPATCAGTSRKNPIYTSFKVDDISESLPISGIERVKQ